MKKQKPLFVVWGRKIYFELYFRALTAVTLALMLVPLLMSRLPYRLYNTDIAYHYNLVLWISRDLANVAYDTYPKLFHVMAALLVRAGLSIETSMHLVSFAFAVMYPVAFYHLALAVFKDKHKALLAAFFSVALWVKTSQVLSGLSMLVPNMVSMVFFVGVSYFLVSRRFTLGGVTLGLYAITHNSFVIGGAAAFIYFLLLWHEKRNVTVWKEFMRVVLVAAAVAAPFFSYVVPRAYFDLYGAFKEVIGGDNPISLVAAPLLVNPVLIAFALMLLGGWSVYKSRMDVNRKFVIGILLLIVAVSQSYFLGFFGGTPFEGVLFQPSRVLQFFLVSAALLSAHYFVERINDKRIIVLLPLVIVAISVNAYWSYHDRIGFTLEEQDVETMRFLQKTVGVRDVVLYDPSDVHSWLVSNMGGGYPIQGDKGFFLLATLQKDPQVAYIVQSNTRLDEYVKTFKNDLTEVFSNGKYVIYRDDARSALQPDYTRLGVYAQGFAAFLDAHANLAPIVKNNLGNPIQLQFVSTDTDEAPCIAFDKSVRATECSAPNVRIVAEQRVLKDLLTTYSV
ncbi:MAG: hypothetical protein HY366_02760, partial [Candidatus Aenigmarchaeota archaeon]|nr:hypothetical protein [Candidatus Aenigmarchaeota archaeon]